MEECIAQNTELKEKWRESSKTIWNNKNILFLNEKNYRLKTIKVKIIVKKYME